jgi:pullulanase-type alpha-1,6-glucosidase
MSRRRSSPRLYQFLILLLIVATALISGSRMAVADHTPDPTSVAIAGSMQSELGCPGDWQPECALTELAYDAGDDVWQQVFSLPAGSFEYKAALNDSWDENYGASGEQGGANIPLNLGATSDVKFYYDHKSHWITDNMNSVIATVAGSFQSEMGCSGDWQPECLRSWLQDPDGDGVYAYMAQGVPEGSYEYKVALDEGWDVSYPSSNKAFSVPAGGSDVTFYYDSASNDVWEVVGAVPPPPGGPAYAVLHYLRDDGDYGDHTTGDYNDYWGLHLWNGVDETIDWFSPKPFLGEDEYGRFAWVKLLSGASNVGFIVHRGDTKDATDLDRFFDPSATPEIWLRQGDPATYNSQAAAQGYATIHYHRDDGDYGDPASVDYNDYWGLHLWGDAIDPAEGTGWTSSKPFDGIDDFGAYWDIQLQDPAQLLNYIIHRGDNKDPGPDQAFIPEEMATAWIMSGDETIYPQRGAAENFLTLHYHRPAGDYGDFASSDYHDFWGLHTWQGADDPGWSTPRKPVAQDLFGLVFKVDLFDNAPDMGYILHRGDEKDPGPDQFIAFGDYGYEVWQPQGADPDDPYILPILGAPGANPGNISQQQAYWVTEDTIAWAAADSSANSYTLHYAPEGGLEATDSGIAGGSSLELTLDPAGLPQSVKDKFPHLADLPALKIGAGDLALVPDILKGQIAVSAVNGDGLSVDATGLQIPGVLDDLYTYDGSLGIVWDGQTPTLKVWAPTAKSVAFHLFDDADPATISTTLSMDLDPASGVWSIEGDAGWKGKYYLYEVEVYVHSTGQVEHNLVTDPYSLSLAMNSSRSQIVDLEDMALAPDGWASLEKPPLAAPEDITIYEIHVRDFSANDPTVPEELKGTFKAFALEDTNGMRHLEALADAGLTHVHLLPVFDIATINEDKSQWQSPDPALLATYPPDSDQQQAAVTATENLDGFNWGYDPWHYTTPEGSYSTDPNGPARIVEFREMIQSLNQHGLRVVMDVVYNHTNASGQNEHSVLDRIVPGYYHRLDDQGQVETSTCCENTASEHKMMEKLMIDSLVTWAKEYKVDAFRFDLMGHHMLSNMINIRAALDALTLEEDGVDGKSIYIYGEGWNFGEVADNARGVNATQLNLRGTGIGTFDDRLRDAVRGGGPFDSGQDLIRRQGFANGLYYDPNALNSGSPEELETLLLLTDQIRVGLAGNLAGYTFIDRYGNEVTGSQVDYNGQPAGYTEDPQEDITYISKHDNQTLYDNNAYKIPLGTSMADRVRIQNLGLSTVFLGQGVPFMQAGSELLRSKSLDQDSYNSGDWFNRLDFTYQANNFGVGLPVAGKNQGNWPIMAPLLADPNLAPAPADIAQMADLYQELLRIRYSSPLFRLQTAEDVQARVAFHNTGPWQIPGLIVMSLSDQVEPGLDPEVERIFVLINASGESQEFTPAGLVGTYFELHPVQQDSADPVVRTASFDMASGAFSVPARTAAVFVEYAPEVALAHLIDDVESLVDEGVLNEGQGNSLIVKLSGALEKLSDDQPNVAINRLEAFINQVYSLVDEGALTPEQGQYLAGVAGSIIMQIEAL